MNEVYDVIVVGCGPAGSTAARLLSENGYRTLLLDKVRLPRYKTCGGGLVRRGFDLVLPQMNGILRKEYFNVQVSDFSLPGAFTLTRKYPVFNMIMRDELDYCLTNAAKSAGAYLIDNCSVKTLSKRENLINVNTEDGSYISRYLIASDGVNSTIAKLSGWKETRKVIPALEYEILLRESDFIVHSEHPRFDFGIIDDGYAWVFPKSRHLSAGVLSMKYLSKTDLKGKMEEYISLLDIKGIIDIKKHGFSIPVKPRSDTFARDNILLTGDAAGLADPITAEGISNALLSGKLAAESIIHDFDVPQCVMRNYNKSINTTIVAELKIAAMVAGLVYRYPSFRRFVLRKYGKVFSELMLQIFCGERTYRELLLNPWNYFKLLNIRG